MSDGLAYWAPPDENPNFISRPPDPGAFQTFKTSGWEALYHSPFYATKRFSELSLEKSDYFNVAGRILDPAEANEKYGLGGQLKFDEPIKEEAAQLMYRRKVDEIDRSYLISSGQTTGMRQAGSFAVSMAATLIDPINVASMFIPVVGEARIARFAQSFGGSALKQRLIQGAATGLMGTAMIEPFILLPALQEQANYNLKDSAINLGFGAALGGMLHAGLGVIGDRLKKMSPKDSDVIFEAAMNNVLKDEPVTAPAKVAEFVDELNPERIESAAVRLPDGTVKTGATHAEIAAGIDLDNLPKGEHTLSDGFVTESGRFVEREEAAMIAHEAGQLKYSEPDSPLAVEDLKGGPESRDPGLLSRGPTIDDIPKRDAKGKFLSKEKRLELLDQKIREEQLAKQDNGGQKVIKDTKEISSSLPKDDLGMTGEHAKDTQTIEADIAEIEKALDLTPEELTKLREDIKAEAGDQPGREKGIVEGLKCIIKNLI
jgi:hypothetical protein